MESEWGVSCVWVIKSIMIDAVRGDGMEGVLALGGRFKFAIFASAFQRLISTWKLLRRN